MRIQEKYSVGGVITKMHETTFGALIDEDWGGHERFASEEEMYKTYRGYYGDDVGPESPLKIIRFTFSKV